MNVVIIEDEGLSARRLKKLLIEIDPSINIEQTLESVEASTKWFTTHHHPSIIFMDIQLSDGICFEIFKHVDIHCPVIFTTAYNEYTLKAFKVNSIDYLLKPIEKQQLQHSLQKFEELKWQYVGGSDGVFEKLVRSLDETRKPYKSRFLIKSGQSFITVIEKDIAYFMSDRKLTFLVARDGKRFGIDESLEELADQLDPHNFFRLNRQFIASINSIESVHTFFNERLKIHLNPPTNHEVLVSRENVKSFKMWLGK